MGPCMCPNMLELIEIQSLFEGCRVEATLEDVHQVVPFVKKPPKTLAFAM